MRFDDYYVGECPQCHMNVRARLLKKEGFNKIRNVYGGKYTFFCYMCPNCRVLFTTGEMTKENDIQKREARDMRKKERRNERKTI